MLDEPQAPPLDLQIYDLPTGRLVTGCQRVDYRCQPAARTVGPQEAAVLMSADQHRRLRIVLAERYLREQTLPISKVAPLLMYREASAFNHALKRWSGKTPKQVRSACSGICVDRATVTAARPN
jgi:hypothetical protein